MEYLDESLIPDMTNVKNFVLRELGQRIMDNPSQGGICTACNLSLDIAQLLEKKGYKVTRIEDDDYFCYKIEWELL